MFLSHVITSSSLHIDHQVHFGPLLLEYEPSLLELIKFLDHKQQIPHFCRASQQKKLESPTLAHHMVPPNWTKIAVAPRRIRLQKVQLSSSSSEDPEVDGTDAVIEKDRCNRIKQRSRKKVDQNFSTRLGLLWWRRGGASARQVLRFCRLGWQLPLPRGEFIIFQEVQVCAEEDVWCGGDEVFFRLDVK